ncbi:MAG: dephospho-CoA kinase [Syntrophobacterales bacterium]|jgi:dephospho-CoA kinase|nr:dephospho-CoA kinase [Syntrophobacterales bacterium]
MITVGITGIIGSGKSTVSRMLREAGYQVIDLDHIAKEVSGSSEVKEDIRRVFGEEFIRDDGSIDVNRMKTLVFQDRERLAMLEKIAHPRILGELARRLAWEKEKGARAVIIDGPLIFEKGMNKELTKTVVISANMETIRKRLLLRGMISEDAERRISNQMPLSEKEKMADHIVNNNGTEQDLIGETNFLLEQIKIWEVEDTCTLMN